MANFLTTPLMLSQSANRTRAEVDSVPVLGILRRRKGAGSFPRLERRNMGILFSSSDRVEVGVGIGPGIQRAIAKIKKLSHTENMRSPMPWRRRTPGAENSPVYGIRAVSGYTCNMSAAISSQPMSRQRTLKYAIGARGYAMHVGGTVNIKLHPAPPNTGIVFRRVDLHPHVEIPARTEFVSDTRLCTRLSKDNANVQTVEHLLSALAGFGIDNAYVDIDSDEVPVFDGSAGPFVLLIKSAGIAIQEELKVFLRIKRKVSVRGDNGECAELLPFEGYCLDVSIDFRNRVIRRYRQKASVNFSTTAFVQEISRARTFGLLSDLQKLQAQGLARGGTLENAILVGDDEILNPEALRSDDDFIKHKMLDAVGDLHLLGRGLIGLYRAHKPGHKLNNRLLKKLIEEERDAWEEAVFSDALPPVRYDGFPLSHRTSESVGGPAR